MIAAGAPILTAADMRAAERRVLEAGISQDDLMERAGAAVARETRRLSGGAPVLVVAGPGNNGGDAYVAARLLRAAGQQVDVAALGPPREGAAARMAARWDGAVHALSDAPTYPVLLDGLLGSGTARPFDHGVTEATRRIVGRARLTIAIDVPSGLDADRGEIVTLAGRSDVTLALGAIKPGLVAGPDNAAQRGHVLLCDIGVDCASPWRTIAPPVLDRLPPAAHKYTRGMVVVIGGDMPGAAALSAAAALRAGAGYVVLAAPRVATDVPHALVQRRVDDARALARLLDDDRIGCVVVGPGLGRGEGARALLDAALASPHRLVADADALWMLAQDGADGLAQRRAPVVLTPHAGEFSRLFGDGSDGKIQRTVAAAGRTGATIVHKGQDSVIAVPDGRAIVTADAPAWLSAAGTGDVLAGIVAARVAAGGEAAVEEAVWLHGEAARRAGIAFAADDLVRQIGPAMGGCLWR